MQKKRKVNNFMAKVKKFNPGDFVVYPAHGVGTVTDINKSNIAGQELELIVVKFDKDKMTLKIPMAKAQQAGLREISSKTTINNAITTLRSKAKVKRAMWSRRAQEYEGKINSGDPISIAEVVRDLYRKSAQSEQSYSERQIYEQALNRLAYEFAASEKIEKDQAIEKINEILLSKQKLTDV